jgi:hypothetical protein
MVTSIKLACFWKLRTNAHKIMRCAMPLHCTGCPKALKIVTSIVNVIIQFCIALKKGVKGLK